MVEQRIDWSYKDNIYLVKAHNKKGEFLGFLCYERVGRFMHYCWYQEVEIRMSPGCLQEVRDMQKKLISKVRVPHNKSTRGKE